jgi:hypothetical protein
VIEAAGGKTPIPANPEYCLVLDALDENGHMKHNGQARTLGPDHGLKISMQKMFLNFLASLCCVLLNTVVLTFFADWHMNCCLAVEDKASTKPLWHPVLKVGPQVEKLIYGQPVRKQNPENFSKPKGWPVFEVGPHEPILEKLLVHDRGFTQSIQGDMLNFSDATAPKERPDDRVLKKTLDDASFKKMINLSIPEGSRQAWAEAFGQIETEAAAQLCSRLKGLSQTEVVKLLGPPAFKAGSPLCFETKHDENHRLYLILGGAPETFDAMDDNWLYFFGGRPMLVRPMFSLGTCVGATANTHDWDSLYNSWRSQQLRRFAVGKKVAEIIAFEGQPNDQQTTRAVQMLENKDPKLTEIFSSADEILSYQFGHLRGELLAIKDGRCTYACENTSPSFTFGATMWEHEPYQATFKMP